MSAELASVQAEFLERARTAGDSGSEFTVAPTDAHPGGVMRGWRYDVNIAFAKRSFLLTTDGLWCSAVRTGPARFGWGVLGGEELTAALQEWRDELIRALRYTRLGA